MPRGPELHVTMRERIYTLYDLGYSYKRIHRIHPEVPISTVKYTIRMRSKQDHQKSLPRPGPRVLTEGDRDYLYDLAINQDNHITYRELAHAIGDVVKPNTISKLFRTMHRRK